MLVDRLKRTIGRTVLASAGMEQIENSNPLLHLKLLSLSREKKWRIC